MYLDFYKLNEMPFRLAPDPRFIYWSSGHAAALACMRSAQVHRNGCAVITGERGTGKTMLLEYLLRREPAGCAVRIDLPPRSLADLQEIVLGRGQSDARPAARVVVCDNAHLFDSQMLEEILTKAMVPASQAPDTRIVLMGEPALAQALNSPPLASLSDLHGEHVELPTLAAVDVIAYISHRLDIAGALGPRLFRDDICVEIHRETRGNPRLVNALCDAALTVACERELSEVGLAELRRGLEDIARLVAAHPTLIQPVAAGLSQDVASDAQTPVLARVRLMYQGELLLERELRRGRLRIGRGIDNDLRIDGRYVSRYHCCILSRENECFLEDVHSTNGLFVNNQRVLEGHRLQDADVIQVGEHELHYVDLRRAWD